MKFTAPPKTCLRRSVKMAASARFLEQMLATRKLEAERDAAANQRPRESTNEGGNMAPNYIGQSPKKTGLPAHAAVGTPTVRRGTRTT